MKSMTKYSVASPCVPIVGEILVKGLLVRVLPVGHGVGVVSGGLQIPWVDCKVYCSQRLNMLHTKAMDRLR